MRAALSETKIGEKTKDMLRVDGLFTAPEAQGDSIAPCSELSHDSSPWSHLDLPYTNNYLQAGATPAPLYAASPLS